MFELVSVFLIDNAVLIGSGAAAIGIIEFVFSPFRTLRNKIRGPEKVQIVSRDTFAPIPTPAPPVEVNVTPATEKGGLLTISLDDYEKRLQRAIRAKEEELTTAYDEEKALLQQQIEELTRRAQNPEAALAEAQETIRKLEDALTREGNEIGEARMEEAREALESGDFSIADDIFAEIEAREQLAVERVARAAFARGEIAEQEIRWADAAEHFAKSARLNPTFDALFKARLHAWRSGQVKNAIAFGERLLIVAETEFGKDTEKYATALNEHSLTLEQAGRYDEAELLYKQAIEIGKATIGESHPSYAIRLNNLANLYENMGRYDEAEPLYKQAIEIDSKTIGENHPDYAVHLSNLAYLYGSMGRYDKAEPLYKQAMEIGKATIGENHPNYAISLNNLANLYRSMGRYDEAEPLFKQAIEIAEATLGPDHPTTKLFKSNLAALQSTR